MFNNHSPTFLHLGTMRDVEVAQPRAALSELFEIIVAYTTAARKAELLQCLTASCQCTNALACDSTTTCKHQLFQLRAAPSDCQDPGVLYR